MGKEESVCGCVSGLWGMDGTFDFDQVTEMGSK